MHRLRVDTVELASPAPILAPAERRHLNVLRPKAGEPIELFDGRGAWRLCRYDAALGELVPEGFVCRDAAPPFPLCLFACVTKGSRWDWTVEKATELGVTRVVPVLSARTIVRIPPNERPVKQARWQRIAEDAARQSDAKWIPEIAAPADFQSVLDDVSRTRCFVGALTSPAPACIAKALADTPPETGARPYAVFVGPEGDFTPGELSALLARAVPVSLGSTVLRAETAAIFALSAVRAFLDVRAR